MRIALIRFCLEEEKRCVPLGLLALATYIKKTHTPIIFDFHLPIRHKPHPAFFEKITKKILNSHPDILGFSTMYNTLATALRVAGVCKKTNPEIPIILGGPEVSFEETVLLKTFKQVDIIVRGEGEITLLEVLDVLEKKKSLVNVLGITFRDKNGIGRTTDRPFIKNLDLLPLPDFSLLPDMLKYDLVPIEGGRGCPFRCVFCSACKFLGGEFRGKSPSRLVHELKWVYQKFKKNSNLSVSIIHDYFLTNRKTAEKFLSLISTQKLSWSCSTRYDALDEDLIKKLGRAGCRKIFIGINKESRLNNLPLFLEAFNQNKIHPILSFIMGFPDENKSELNQTLLTALSSKLSDCSPTIKINRLTFLKGSDLYNVAKNKLSKEKLHEINTSLMLTHLPDELSLIKKYRQVFPSFYYVKCSKLEPEDLSKISYLFSFLTEYFPATTSLLLKILSLTPCLLALKIISFFDHRRFKWVPFWKEELTSGLFLPTFNNFLKKILRVDLKNLQNLIKELVTHEMLFQKANLANEISSPTFSRMELESRPKINREVKIKAYNYDILEVIENLKAKRGKPIKETRSFLIYVPGKVAKAISLSPLSHVLLMLCKRKRSIQDIINLIAQENGKIDKTTSRLILNRLKILHDNGVIRV